MDLPDQWIAETLTQDDVWQHRVKHIFAHCKTPFQELHIVDSGVYGKALVLDGRWQTCVGDEFIYHESLVHSSLITHGNPRRVLIAGGADGGAAREVLKWKSVEEIILVDIDQAAVDACRQWLPEIHQGSLNDPRVRVVVADACEIIANSRDWDVIIADLTDPIESGPAYQLFTREFFRSCQDALAPGGVFINQAGSMSPPLISLLARTAKTIMSVFREAAIVGAHVPTYGSPWAFVLASDRPFNQQPDPSIVDQQLRQSTVGRLRVFDGQAFLGMLQTPKYVREAIASETVIYTLADPPKVAR